MSVLRLCCSMAPSPKKTRTDLWALERAALTLNSSWYGAPLLSLPTQKKKSKKNKKRHLLTTLCEVSSMSPAVVMMFAVAAPSREHSTVPNKSTPVMCLPAVLQAHCLFIRSDIFFSFHSLIILLIPSPFEGSNPQSSGPKHRGNP